MTAISHDVGSNKFALYIRKLVLILTMKELVELRNVIDDTLNGLHGGHHD